MPSSSERIITQKELDDVSALGFFQVILANRAAMQDPTLRLAALTRGLVNRTPQETPGAAGLVPENPDFVRPEIIRALNEGADPNAVINAGNVRDGFHRVSILQSYLADARFGRDPETLQALVSHGANLDFDPDPSDRYPSPREMIRQQIAVLREEIVRHPENARIYNQQIAAYQSIVGESGEPQVQQTSEVSPRDPASQPTTTRSASPPPPPPPSPTRAQPEDDDQQRRPPVVVPPQTGGGAPPRTQDAAPTTGTFTNISDTVMKLGFNKVSENFQKSDQGPKAQDDAAADLNKLSLARCAFTPKGLAKAQSAVDDLKSRGIIVGGAGAGADAGPNGSAPLPPSPLPHSPKTVVEVGR